MSGNVATLAGGAAGAFVGSFFGMPGLGFSIGSGLAGMAFAPKPKGNSVDPGDLSFDTSAYGKFQPWGYGTYLVQGPVTFWSTDYVAHKHTEKVGGKGGGAGKQKVETITYTRSFAVYLADCTNGTPIGGVRRIWDAISGQMLYDVGEAAGGETVFASQSFAKSVRVYTGSLSQQPDPLIEAHEGWSPAWRGHAYIVFEDWDHGGSKQAPVLAIEITQSVPAPAAAGTPKIMTFTPRFQVSALCASNAHGACTFGVGDWDANYSSYGVQMWQVYPDGTLIKGLQLTVDDNEPVPQGFSDEPSFSASNWAWGGRVWYYRFSDDAQSVLGTVIIDLPAEGYANFNNFGSFHKRGDWIYLFSNWEKVFRVGSGGGLAQKVLDTTTAGLPGTLHEIAIGDNEIYGVLTNDTVLVWDLDFNLQATYPFSPTEVLSYSHFGGSETQLYSDIRGRVYLLSVNQLHVLEEGVYRYVGQVANAQGYEMYGGWAARSGFLGSLRLEPTDSNDAGYRTFNLAAAAPGGIGIGQILADLCARSGLESGDYDTSLLPATTARLSIDRFRPAREWLAELGNIYRYRMRNSGGKLQFVPKGEAAVVTIDQADLGLDVGEGIRPPITASRTQGIDLPRSVTVVYSDADNDYAPGQQQYVMRQYPQGQDITLTVTAILNGVEALELAQIAAKEPHLERLSWTTSVGIKHLALEAGDVVDLPTGRTWVRDIQEQGDSILRATFVAEAAAAYSGNGLPAPATTAPVRSIALAGPTRMELLDIPILQDADDGPGIYLAALGYLAGWSGAEIYRSDDGEVFDPLASVVTAAVIGTTTDALAAGTTTIWDRANTLNVALIDGSLSSAGELNVLNGANAALVGAHGRWEIIQFETATLEADGTYTLSKLLRGRKGTEWAVGTHQAGDTFVLLTNNTLGRVDKSLNDIGATRQYKAVSFGNDISAAAAVSFSNAGVGLKPYAVSHVTGSRNGSGDLTVKWIRRTRIGGEWRDYVDASLGEDSESYEVDIMNGSTVVRTLAVTSPTATYMAADQTSDFGSTQSSITLRVYQLSADIGRGYHTEVTL